MGYLILDLETRRFSIAADLNSAGAGYGRRLFWTVSKRWQAAGFDHLIDQVLPLKPAMVEQSDRNALRWLGYRDGSRRGAAGAAIASLCNNDPPPKPPVDERSWEIAPTATALQLKEIAVELLRRGQRDYSRAELYRMWKALRRMQERLSG